jgi:hypothetical protein
MLIPHVLKLSKCSETNDNRVTERTSDRPRTLAVSKIFRGAQKMYMRSILTRGIGAVLLVMFCAPAFAGSTESFTFSAKSYPGSRDRQYKVYIPDGQSVPAPMVMALHACQQTNDDVLRDWGLMDAVDRFGFILVAPFITSYDGVRNPNCMAGGFFGLRALSTGDHQDIGFAYDSLSNVTLHEGEPGKWYTHTPETCRG